MNLRFIYRLQYRITLYGNFNHQIHVPLKIYLCGNIDLDILPAEICETIARNSFDKCKF